jgi:hypothetical protein
MTSTHRSRLVFVLDELLRPQARAAKPSGRAADAGGSAQERGIVDPKRDRRHTKSMVSFPAVRCCFGRQAANSRCTAKPCARRSSARLTAITSGTSSPGRSCSGSLTAVLPGPIAAAISEIWRTGLRLPLIAYFPVARVITMKSGMSHAASTINSRRSECAKRLFREVSDEHRKWSGHAWSGDTHTVIILRLGSERLQAKVAGFITRGWPTRNNFAEAPRRRGNHPPCLGPKCIKVG